MASKHCNDPEPFIEYSNDINDTHENIDEQNPYKKCKIMIVFDIILDLLSNKIF